MRVATGLCGLVLFLAANACPAADGDLDATFGNYLPGVSKIAFDLGGNTYADVANALLVQSDGRLVLVGPAFSSATDSQIAITRLLPSGAIDTSFGSGGRTTYAPAGTVPTVLAAALQSDGKILAAGQIRAQESTSYDFFVCRFGSSGALDTGFGDAGCATIAFDVGGSFDEVANAVAVQSDGRIVVGGCASGADYSGYFAFARLDTHGALDGTFGFGGSGKQIVTRFQTLRGDATSDCIHALVIQSDGKIIGAGTTNLLAASNRDFAVARLDTTGQLDESYGNGGVQIVAFDIGGGDGDDAYAAALQHDGKLVLAGRAASGLSDANYALVRLLTNGIPDFSFFGSGKRVIAFDVGGAGTDVATGVALQSDGKIVVAGTIINKTSDGIYGEDLGICRVLPNGNLDMTFGDSGKRSLGLNLGRDNNELANAFALQGGRPVIAGPVALEPDYNYDFFAVRFTGGLIFTSGFEP